MVLAEYLQQEAVAENGLKSKKKTYNRPDARVFNVIQTAFDRELDHAFRCLASTT